VLRLRHRPRPLPMFLRPEYRTGGGWRSSRAAERRGERAYHEWVDAMAALLLDDVLRPRGKLKLKLRHRQPPPRLVRR